MKSKISFFNKTIFRKNVTLYWPIWTLYTIILVFVQPVMFWSECYYSRFRDQYTYSDKLKDFISVLSLDVHIYVLALFALASGMALFHYMYNQKSANMIHAFPIDRKQLFGTNVISGILFLAGPQMISTVLLAIVAMCNGINEVQYAFYWLLLVIGIDIVAMAVVTFCGMFTGHLAALPVYVIILNYFSYWVYYILNVVITVFGYGVNYVGGTAETVAAMFSPSVCLSRNTGIVYKFNELRECTGILVYGVDKLVIYLVVAIVLYAAAYTTYRKRHVEQAGEFITVEWVKPIARFGIALSAGVFLGLLLREFLRQIGIGCTTPVFVVIMLAIGMMAYFIADMFIHKSFHVFKKNNWKRCGICMVLMLVTFFGLYGVAKSYEDYQPELAEIESASVSVTYEITKTGEDIEIILALHDQILKNKEICIREYELANFNYQYVSIHYKLKNGDNISRSYALPRGYEELDAVMSQIADLELDPENYLKYVFDDNYEEIDTFYGGWLEAQMQGDAYTSLDFTAEQTEELFHAVVADAYAGNLLKYNGYNRWIAEYVDGYEDVDWGHSEVYLLLEYKNPSSEEEHVSVKETIYYGASVEMIEDTSSHYSVHLNIGPDCENVINKLIEFGIIRSVDDIWWGENAK